MYGIVVSGYSGSDIVARQLLGAMCLNKTAILPPDFCLMQTAHDPGSVRTADGIDARITESAARIAKIQTVQKLKSAGHIVCQTCTLDESGCRV